MSVRSPRGLAAEKTGGTVGSAARAHLLNEHVKKLEAELRGWQGARERMGRG